MLTITVPGQESWDSVKEEFVTTKEQTLELEHSLLSVSKWESKWNKSFLSCKDMTNEQSLDYIRCMTIGKVQDDNVYYALSQAQVNKIKDYINAPMTATTFNKRQNGPKSREVVTSELIYYWMISLQIPFECQKWHLNRLLTLIEVCNVKQTPPKKMKFADMANQRRALNASRRKANNSRG